MLNIVSILVDTVCQFTLFPTLEKEILTSRTQLSVSTLTNHIVLSFAEHLPLF